MSDQGFKLLFLHTKCYLSAMYKNATLYEYEFSYFWGFVLQNMLSLTDFIPWLLKKVPPVCFILQCPIIYDIALMFV